MEGGEPYAVEGSFLDVPDASQSDDDEDEMDWEGAVYADEARELVEAPAQEPYGEPALEDRPIESNKKRSTPAGTGRAARSLKHKVEVLCLLAHYGNVDKLCADAMIQAHLLSLVPTSPSKKRKRAEGETSSTHATDLLHWFRVQFGLDDSNVLPARATGAPSQEELLGLIQSRQLTDLDANVLFVALCRVSGIPARLVVPIEPQTALSPTAKPGGSRNVLNVWCEIFKADSGYRNVTSVSE